MTAGTQPQAAPDAHEDGPYRLLRALATVGIFHEPAPRTFALTPRANCRGVAPPAAPAT